MTGFVLDTSVFIAVEQDRALGEPPPGDPRVSVATFTELGVGVRRAPDGRQRGQRQLTLDRARRFIPLSLDERVADHLADILAAARDAGRRAGAMDAIIAATALAHDLAIWTQDQDFDVLAELAPTLRVHRG